MALGFDTALNVINDTAFELGLYSTAVADVYASTDPNVVLLRTLLKRVGQELLREHDWSAMQKEHSFVTVQGTSTYALPTDYLRMVPQTHWDRSVDLSLGGPLNAQEWHFLKGVGVDSTVVLQFRISQQLIKLFPDTDTAGDHTLAFEYMSRYWVKPSGQSVATAETPTASTDTLWYDRLLLVAALKLEWLKTRGFRDEAVAAKADRDRVLYAAKADDTPGPVLNASRRNGIRRSVLNGPYLPPTGWGGA